MSGSSDRWLGLKWKAIPFHGSGARLLELDCLATSPSMTVTLGQVLGPHHGSNIAAAAGTAAAATTGIVWDTSTDVSQEADVAENEEVAR